MITCASKEPLHPQSLLDLLVQFYSGLTTKKDMQNISSEIRQFVMTKNDLPDKETLAKTLLDYFLKLESKMHIKSDSNWDQMFKLQITRGQALLSLTNYPSRNLLRHSFSVLKQSQKYATIAASEFYSILESTKTISHPYDFDNIEIEESVKVKTYYFFKWCQYIEQVKMLKELKMREVENQKISANFNKYGLKFNYFTAWKKVYKKNKLERERVQIIQSMSNKRILTKSIHVIEEVSAIIAFESQLASKVAERLIDGQKRMLFKKLKANSENVKAVVSSRKFSNEYAQIFIRNCFKNIKPLMNHSYQLSREKFLKEAQKSTLCKMFKAMKKLNEESKDKFSKSIIFLKKNILQHWINNFGSKKDFEAKNRRFSQFLTLRRKRIAVTILNFNKLAQKQKFSLIESIISANEELKLCDATFFSAQKSVFDKKSLLTNFLLRQHKKELFDKLHKNHEQCLLKQRFSLNQTCIFFKRLLSRQSSYNSKKAQKVAIFKRMEQISIQNTIRKCFLNWKKLKLYHRIQQQRLNSIANCGQKIVMIIFWNRFKFRLEQKQGLIRLSNAINQAFLKISLTKIVGKSKVINEKVGIMRSRKNIAMMKKLWGLLLANQSFNDSVADKIHEFYGKKCQSTLIRNLQEVRSLNCKGRKISSQLEQSYKQQFIRKFRMLFTQKYEISSKSQEVSKKVFMKYYQKSVQNGRWIQQSNEEKIEKLDSKLTNLSALKILAKLKANKDSATELRQKEEELFFHLVTQNILKVKDYIRNLQEKKAIAECSQKIKATRVSSCISILSIRYKARLVSENIQAAQAKIAIKDFMKICDKQNKISEQSAALKSKISQRRMIQLYRFLEIERKEMKIKTEKVMQLHEKNIKTGLRTMIDLLKSNKENIENGRALQISKKHALFSEFMAMNLRNKFSRIKFNCSLKFYAKNLLKKGFKSFKNIHSKLKQKQNLIRLDKTSSILIEKSIQKSFKSNSLSEQIQRFNLRRSRQVR